MTKFYLHGGRTRIECKGNRNFFHNLVKENNPNNILIMTFASNKTDWNEKYQIDIENFEKYNPGKELNFVMASENPEELEDQIKKADIIYMRGGDTPKLQKQLKKLNNLKELFNNKVISGNSAGVLVLTKHYYTDDYKDYRDGLGILNIKAIVHYSEKLNHVIEKLDKYGEKLPIYKIPECEYILIEN